MEAPAPVEPDEHAALRADIRRLGNLLGESLVRQEGPELLDLVERVRGLARSDPEALGEVLESLDLPTAAKLCRAFGTYFHLANVTEQVHRARTMSSERQDKGSWLAQAVDRISDSGLDTKEVTELVSRVAVRPTFTAHPTEAARRSILSKRRRVAELLETSAPGDEHRADRRIAEVIDLLWQTDELRQDRPEPLDEARNAAYYLDELMLHTVGDVLEDLAEELGRPGDRPARDRDAAAVRHLDRWRPRRQPVRDGRRHGRRARPAARSRDPRHHPARGRPDAGPVVLGEAGRRERSPAGEHRSRSRDAAGDRGTHPAHQRRRALPPQGAVHPAAAGEHPRAHRHAAALTNRDTTTSVRRVCWPTCS